MALLSAAPFCGAGPPDTGRVRGDSWTPSSPHGSTSCPTRSGLQCVTQPSADMPDFGGRLSATTVSSQQNWQSGLSPLRPSSREPSAASIIPTVDGPAYIHRPAKLKAPVHRGFRSTATGIRSQDPGKLWSQIWLASLGRVPPPTAMNRWRTGPFYRCVTAGRLFASLAMTRALVTLAVGARGPWNLPPSGCRRRNRPRLLTLRLMGATATEPTTAEFPRARSVARRARSESEAASRELTAAAARWSITRDGLAAAIDQLCEGGVKAALRKHLDDRSRRTGLLIRVLARAAES
jgi:hypothetical protein